MPQREEGSKHGRDGEDKNNKGEKDDCARCGRPLTSDELSKNRNKNSVKGAHSTNDHSLNDD